MITRLDIAVQVALAVYFLVGWGAMLYYTAYKAWEWLRNRKTKET